MNQARNLVRTSLPILLVVFIPVFVARADIYQWEYIDPADPGLGKRQSATLTPGGAGVTAEPVTNLSNRDLTRAYLVGADLTFAEAFGTNLTDAELVDANLTAVWFGRYFDSPAVLARSSSGIAGAGFVRDFV